MIGKIRILYIDDYELDRELVRDALEKEHGGFEVMEASNQREFEALLKEHDFDVVLSDFNIAGFEGLEVIEAVHAHNQHIPVIIVTGTGSEEIAAKALKQGAADYVIKRPKHIQRLPQTILTAIEKQTLRDQRRETEVSLKESEKRYRSLFENMLNGFAYCIMIFDQNKPIDFIYLDVNRAFETLTGLKGVVGKKVSDVIPGIRETDPNLFEIYGRVALTGKPETFEIYVEALSMWFSISVYSPEKEHFVTVFDVITERKLVEDELRQYEHIVSNTRDMLALIDKDFVYLAVNKAYLQAFAKKWDEVIGRTVAEVFGEEFFSTVIRSKAERCLAGENIRYRDWFEFPKAGRKYMELSYSPYLGPDAGVLGFVVNARDITEYEILQAQLIQAQKMESVGRLAGGVAHDYNNILSVILGYTELALDKVDPKDPLHADLEEILTAARRSTEITRQLLAFARKQTIDPKVLDLNETLEAMLKMLRQLIGEDIEIAWHPRANLWPIKMDPSQLDQILANLCVNARDAIAGVGKVTIETDKETFDAAYCSDHVGFVPGKFVLLAVSDDGSGMDKETLAKLFEPFFTTKEVGRGTGLGLATVYGIVKQNNGFINVYSEPGKGTTFKIYLPRHAGEAEEKSVEGEAEIPRGRGETILVVEDDISILKLANRILEGLGYNVLAAKTPNEAMVLTEEHANDIHLIITDVVMPEMNGRDLAERLHALNPDIKVLFMSGYTANVIAHRGVLEEGVNFIQKPFSTKDLAAKVREALETSKT